MILFADGDWQAAQLALIGVVIAIAAAFSEGFRQLIPAIFRKLTKSIEREKRVYRDGVIRIANFHEVLEAIGKMPFVDRVLIFTGTNCGGVPDPKKPYVVKCFYGWSDIPGKNPESLYNFPLKVDHHYIAMILEIINSSEGAVSVTTETMPENSQLRSYYQVEGVQHSRLYMLHLSDTELIYISVASYTKSSFTDDESRQVDLSINRLRSVLAD